MLKFTYSAMSDKNDPMFEKFEHPIKALIENESNICEERKSILDTLYKVEKSNSEESEFKNKSTILYLMKNSPLQDKWRTILSPVWMKT